MNVKICYADVRRLLLKFYNLRQHCAFHNVGGWCTCWYVNSEFRIDFSRTLNAFVKYLEQTDR